jgi:D-tagatose-1,6-bisphosphate aldolase subunit GatZ/KbaZ
VNARVRNSSAFEHAGARLQEIIRRNRASRTVGAYAVCSAHQDVIRAAAREAKEQESVLHVESTSSQVNQFGGYTGQNPEQFAKFVHAAAHEAGLSEQRVLIGGDHLGPFPWRRESAPAAMEKANSLVRDCVLAGYQKIHLDASMACADDPTTGPDEQTVAMRAAVLCETAETAHRKVAPSSSPLLYVIGTEVPAPGGESHQEESIAVTPSEHVHSTLEAFQRAFVERRLNDAWERVIGLVVQPGVEFGDTNVFNYDRSQARALSTTLPATPELVYEAHSTDYQFASSLKHMVEDHFAILKVGPELTFAFREAIFALSAIEREYLYAKATRVSNVREALEAAMLRNSSYWRDYYSGDDNQLRISRFYSYSDRCRYYWPEPTVQAEIRQLIQNLATFPPPLALISQYLPGEYEAIREGRLQPCASELIEHHIGTVLHKYAVACGETQVRDPHCVSVRPLD